MKLPEKMNYQNLSEMRSCFQRLIESDLKVIVLNFEKTISIDSVSFGNLMIFIKNAMNKKKKIIIKNLGKDLKQIGNILGMFKIENIEII